MSGGVVHDNSAVARNLSRWQDVRWEPSPLGRLSVIQQIDVSILDALCERHATLGWSNVAVSHC